MFSLSFIYISVGVFHLEYIKYLEKSGSAPTPLFGYTWINLGAARVTLNWLGIHLLSTNLTLLFRCLYICQNMFDRPFASHSFPPSHWTAFAMWNFLNFTAAYEYSQCIFSIKSKPLNWFDWNRYWLHIFNCKWTHSIRFVNIRKIVIIFIRSFHFSLWS